MKNLVKILSCLWVLTFATGCVHDEQYDTPNLSGYQCGELQANLTLKALKAMPPNTTITQDAVIEGYVSSSDESGNIYKTIFIQDSPENPTEGLVVSVDAVSTYTRFPQGSKVYIKVKGLAMGTYGGLVQLGAMDGTTFGRISEAALAQCMLRSCASPVVIKPKVMTLADMKTANDQYLGCLIQVNDAEFDAKNLCATFAPDGTGADRQINDPTTSVTTRVVRNSGYASFANQKLPSGKGKLIGVLSKYSSTYQIYLNRIEDVADMKNFPRKDGITADPCSPANIGNFITIQQLKDMYASGALSQINTDIAIKGLVSGNDISGNFFKFFYLQDATGGIRININKTNLYTDSRFRIGRELSVKLKDLYIAKRDGEFQIGQPFQNSVGQIAEADAYKYFFEASSALQNVPVTKRTIPQVSHQDIGRLITIDDVQFIDGDVGTTYAAGTTTNRTLTDCAGNKIILRTSNFANFAGNTVDGGKGSITAIVSYYAPTNQYQLWIQKPADADFDNARCDGSMPATALLIDGFDNFSNWVLVSKAGAQLWNIQNFGNPAPCAVMSGYQNGNYVNEDWLISKPINLSGKTQASFSFDSDGRYAGPALEVYVAETYSGDPATTNWTKVSAILDSDMTKFGTWTNSGSINVNQFAGKQFVVALKYTSDSMTAATWEIDNFKVLAK